MSYKPKQTIDNGIKLAKFQSDKVELWKLCFNVGFSTITMGAEVLNLANISEIAEYLSSTYVFIRKAYKKIEVQAKKWLSY